MLKDLNDEHSEIHYLYKSLYPKRTSINHRIISYYNKAVVQLIVDPSTERLPVQKVNIPEIIKRGLDIEAIELALRIKKISNDLTQRFHILIYICESQPDHYFEFINEKKSTLNGFLLLAVYTIRSICKLFKGLYLLRKYELL